MTNKFVCKGKFMKKPSHEVLCEMSSEDSTPARLTAVMEWTFAFFMEKSDQGRWEKQ